MKVLLDHNLPHKLRTRLGVVADYEFVTASYVGWGNLENGELLKTAEESGFEIFITGDQTLPYEQNLAGRKLAIVALSTNNWPIIKNYIPQILAAIENAAPSSFQVVECGTFHRKNTPGE